MYDDQMTDEERDFLEAEEKAQEERRHAIDRLGMTLASKKDKCVDHKADIEARWLRDERQYWGINWGNDNHSQDDEDYQVTDNKTKQKTRTVAARIGDMMFPTNDKNWAMKRSPYPTDIDGQPLDPAEADDAAERAEERIDDYLTECNYSKSGRKAIFDGCRIGTGILKGPFSKGVTRRQVGRRFEPVMDQMGQPMIDPQTGEPMMQPGRPELTVVSETKPAAARVDPWMWFPLPARNVDECEGSFELHLHTKDRLRELARYDFDADAIRRLLELDPDQGKERGLLTQRRDLLRANNEALENTYTVWEYHGPLEREDLEVLGLGQDDMDPLESVRAEIWFCQGIILKVELAPLADDYRIPYYVWCYEEDEADIFGYGVPYIMRDEQIMLDSSLNAMKLNSELTAGPQTVEFKGKVIPADGNKKIRGPKHWVATDPEMTDFREAIQFHYIESSIATTMPLYQLAAENADQNTMLPMMAQGEATNAHPTSSGTAMLMNASNIVQRMAAHNWDDNITIPMISRFFYWLVEFDDDDSIKLDLEVDARGASYLLVKDMQAQHGMMLLNLAGQDPELRAMLDMEETYRTVVNFLDVPTDRLFKDPDMRQQEHQAMAEQQQMQKAAAEAEIRLKQAQAMKAEAEAQAAQMGPDQSSQMFEFEREQMRFQIQMAEIEAKMTIAQMDRDARLAMAAADKEIKVTELMGKLQTAEKDQAMRGQIEQMRLMQKEQSDARKDRQAGIQARIAMERKALRERQYDLRERNINQGHDSF